MNSDETQTAVDHDWPRFTMKYAFGCQVPGIDEVFNADEVVLFDPTMKGGSHWLSAKKGSYVPLEETR